ncbi:MAG: lipase family protein [Stenomitos rutilans HA7619-LM2]|jgi:pimeloyl-ACP methyl ester carboxylesterase|nr:lipase family protein [Stenomitos rutilans HA7619-LM2]
MMDNLKAIKCALLSQEIYNDFTQLKFADFPDITPAWINQATTDTQGALLVDGNDSSLYIVFRGSEQRLDWHTNFEFSQKEADFQQAVIEQQIVQNRAQVYPYAAKSSSGAKMHQGFVDAYFSVREQIHTYLRDHPTTRVTVTGHSLGGALATLCAVDVQYNFSSIAIELYTFGAPRVGNSGFCKSFNERVPKSYRFIYGMDIVPALPRPWQGYSHVDAEYRLGPRLSLNFLTQRFKDHAISNYLDALKKQAT